MKKIVVLLLSVALFVPAGVRADDSMNKALSVIPADAIGFVCVPSVKQLDADFQSTIQRLGLSQMIAPPFNSLQGILQTFLRVGEGFDPNGPVVLVFPQANNWMEMTMKSALILPATNPRALLESMGATAGEDGVWTTTINGQPAVAAPGEKVVVVGQLADVAKAFAKGDATKAGSFDPHDLATLEGMDIALWIDGERLIKIFRQQIDGMINMLAMMQTAQGPGGATQAELTKRQFSEFRDGAAALTLGIGLNDDGLAMRLGFRAKKGSELAKRMKVRPTRDSLLRGLPADDYLVAFGATLDPEAAAQVAEQFDGYFAMVEHVEGVDTEQLNKLKGMLKDWAPLTSGVRGVFSALTPGTDGLFGLALVFDTKNNGRWIDTFAQMIETAMKLPKSDSEHIDEDVKRALDALSFHRDAERVAGVSVHRLAFDLAAAEDMDEEDKEEVRKVLGAEGFVLRTAAVGDDHVVVAFGGGTKYFAKVVEQTKSNAAPLDGEPGIQAVAKHLPRERAGVAFIDVDRFIHWLAEVGKVVDDEEEFPVKMPAIDAPLAVASTGGEAWQMSEVLFPTQLLVATKDAVMGVMGGGAPPTAGNGGAGSR